MVNLYTWLYTVLCFLIFLWYVHTISACLTLFLCSSESSYSTSNLSSCIWGSLAPVVLMMMANLVLQYFILFYHSVRLDSFITFLISVMTLHSLPAVNMLCIVQSKRWANFPLSSWKVKDNCLRPSIIPPLILRSFISHDSITILGFMIISYWCYLRCSDIPYWSCSNLIYIVAIVSFYSDALCSVIYTSISTLYMKTIFLQRYLETIEFLESFEKLLGTKAKILAFREMMEYKDFMEQWNLPVYFQIRWVP